MRSIIDLAHNLGLSVVAEGIEDEATWERLRAAGLRDRPGLPPRSPDHRHRRHRAVSHRAGRALTSSPSGRVAPSHHAAVVRSGAVSMPPPPPSSPPPPPPSFGGQPYGAQGVGTPLAGAWMRILARFIDGLILLIVTSVIGAVLLSGEENLGFGGVTSEDVPAGKLFLILLLSLAVSFVYEATLTARLGGTPMKRAFGMRVVDAVTGAGVTMQQSAIRWAVPGLVSLLPRVGAVIQIVVTIVSLVFLFTHVRRQTVSDRVARTARGRQSLTRPTTTEETKDQTASRSRAPVSLEG